MKTPSPPADLSVRARAFYLRMVADFEIDDAPGVELLLEACRALDRADQARAVLDVEGVVVIDRYEQRKPHPAAAIENSSRITFARLLRELNVSDEPPEVRVPRIPRRAS
jgi:hypothetical protein